MTVHELAREHLWDIASEQHGFVTAQQAAGAGVSTGAQQMLVHRGTMTRAAHGVYRFPRFPIGQFDGHMLAVLWTRVPEACLSHETALDAYDICDVNPNRFHVTIARRRRLRRAGGEAYEIHYEDLDEAQIGWWQQIPIVTPATAISQCLAYGTPTYLLRQAIERDHTEGLLTTSERHGLASELGEHRRVGLAGAALPRSAGDGNCAVDPGRRPAEHGSRAGRTRQSGNDRPVRADRPERPRGSCCAGQLVHISYTQRAAGPTA